MRDLPVVLDGYRLTVVEPPAPKTREDEQGNEVAVVDREGVTVFVVSLFAKARPSSVQPRVPKGEEIRVTLATDPGMGFEEDVRVELVGPVVNHYAIESGRGVNAGLSFKATGMKLAGAGAGSGGRGKQGKESGAEGEQ